MDKNQKLVEWKEHLRELLPEISKQINWLSEGDVQAEISEDCPENLKSLAGRLVEIQNENGIYQRKNISSADIEKIKYYSDRKNVSFGDIIDLVVKNNRYLSKDGIEARNIASYILEIQSVFNQYYEKYGVFPINAMNADVKRGARDPRTGISLKDRVEAIIEVFLPEYQDVNVVETDFSIVPQRKYELTNEDIMKLVEYFSSKAHDENINACFNATEEKEFIKHSRLLAKARISLDEFLKTYVGLNYSKCYEIQVLPAVEHMLNTHRNRTGTTINITTTDPYLRNKIDVAERVLNKHSMPEVLDALGIAGDNTGDGRNQLAEKEIESRYRILIHSLKSLYPTGEIEKDFIKKYPEKYQELKLISSRKGFTSMDAFLHNEGLTRASSHKRVMENVIYLSESDLIFYNFDKIHPVMLEKWGLRQLDPAEYFGVYNKLIASGLDHSQYQSTDGYYLGE